MSIIDKFLDVMRLNDDDYEFDNEDYDYDEEEDYEVKEKKPSRRERKKEEEQQQTAATFDISEKQRQKQQNKITPINRNRRQGQPGMEVCVIKPTTIEDEIEITETLLNGRTVVINMEGLSVDNCTADHRFYFRCYLCHAWKSTEDLQLHLPCNSKWC